MSAAVMSAPARQPFGSMSGARLRNLTNTKNTQNAIIPGVSSALKRHAPTEFDDADIENIDPLKFFSASGKKTKSFDFDNTNLAKAPVFALNTVTKQVELPRIAGQKRKGEDMSSMLNPKRQEPNPVSVPAGRSPKSKHKGLLSRRRLTTNPFTRVNPPAYGQSGGVAFSIDAALAGSTPVPKTTSKSKASTKGWHFNIHEDSPDEEMANLMEHSTSTLDISEDEGRSSPKGDRDNKENIPPADFQNAGIIPSTRRDLMTDEIRSPLGDLNTTDYYAAGCDASSVFVVAGDELENEKNVQGPAEGQDDAPEIHIWESASAKGEDDDLVNEIASAAAHV